MSKPIDLQSLDRPALERYTTLQMARCDQAQAAERDALRDAVDASNQAFRALTAQKAALEKAIAAVRNEAAATRRETDALHRLAAAQDEVKRLKTLLGRRRRR